MSESREAADEPREAAGEPREAAGEPGKDILITRSKLLSELLSEFSLPPVCRGKAPGFSRRGCTILR
eukprot:1433480-Pleurochrysis_carterae.AAC.1